MESRHGGGGTGGSFPAFSLDNEDDFLFLDPNIPPLDSIASDFSAFLDSTGPSSSLLPADEWSGTSNTLPDTPSSHQQLQQHALEGSSPLQNQIQTAAAVVQLMKQQQQPQQPQQQQQQQQQFVFETQSHSHVPPGGASQASSDAMSIQAGDQQPQQIDAHQSRTSSLHQMENHRESGYPSKPVMQFNVSVGQPSFTPAGATTPREMVLQSPGFQSGGGKQELESDGGGFGQGLRSFESFQGRQLPGFQGQLENGMRMSLPRGLMVNSHFGMTGSSGQQKTLNQGQQALNDTQGSDGDGVALQSNLMNNQANFSGHCNALHQSQYLAKAASARQSIISGHALSNLPAYQLQSSHQLPMQGQGKMHPQVMANQVINQGLLQPRQVPLGSQPLVFSSTQQPTFQMLQQQGYQIHPNSGAHLPFGKQAFPPMQPRLQNQLLQGLRFGAPQLGPLVGQQIASGPSEMGRYPPPGTNAAKCAQLFMLYIQEQRTRPTDNNINFWRDFVRKYFAPGATNRWCLTSCSTTPVGKHAQGLFPMGCWYCNLCGVHPGRGFESGTDVLPRLFKIKYDSGLLDELLFLDVATEKYSLPAGKVVLEYSTAVHESVFSELRVIRQGKLRVTFNNSFKICSWEFCTKAHEEVVPRRNLLQQVHQLASLVIESDQENFEKSADNLKNYCNAFTKAAKQLAVQLDAPMVNDLGFSKRYVRCLQIAEVVNSMKDLISFEKKTGLGPIESLARFPTLKKLQMEGGITGPFSLTQMINELTQGQSSLQSSAVTRLQSESMSEAQEQAGNQSVFKGMDQRNAMDSRLQHLLNSENYSQLQASSQTQSGPVQSHSVQLSQALPQTVSQPAATQAPANQQQQQQANQIGPQQNNYQQLVLNSGAAKSLLSQPQSVNQTSGTPHEDQHLRPKMMMKKPWHRLYQRQESCT